MPQHYNPHVPGHKTRGLSAAMKKRLDKHAEHHTKAHIDKMIKHMKDGMSFNKAHEMAMRSDPPKKSASAPKKSMAKKPMAKGLTQGQKKLPPALQKAILASKKK